jgi:hypothetical protein
VNLRTGLTILVACTIAVAAGLIYRSQQSWSEESGAASDAAAGTAPTTADPAMHTETVPVYRDDGVVPLPSDAIGRSTPAPRDNSKR